MIVAFINDSLEILGGLILETTTVSARINITMNLYDLILCTNHILFESFKSDLIDTYNKNGVQVDGNQKLLTAVQIFNNNNLIKDKVKKDLKNPPNIAIALVNSFPNPQDLIEYIDGVQQSFAEKDQQNKEKKQRKEQAKKVSDDFFVYPCHTFEEAHSAAFSHTGSLERLSNEEIKKKYKIEVPSPGSFFKTDKSPAEFLEYMKNAPFFMSPSWCVTANKDHWNSYALSTEKGSAPKCYIIISKAYPNLRFCIVLRHNNARIDKMTGESVTISKKLEVRELRDPWQIGSVTGERIKVGKEMLDLAFNKSEAVEDIITKAAKSVTVVKRFNDITDDGFTFSGISNLTQFNSDLPNLKNGAKMFAECENLTSFNGSLPKLENGDCMFAECKKLVSFNTDLPNLEDGKAMFHGCNALTSFKGDLSNLEKAFDMFRYCHKLTSFDASLDNLNDGRFMFLLCDNITSFDIDLPNLEDGYCMFDQCEKLTSFSINMPKLWRGYCMFKWCHSLTSFRGDLSSMTYGDEMFVGCNNLTSFHSNLSSLKYGRDMFRGCRLDKESVINIASTLPTLQNRDRIDIGIDASLKRNKDITKAIRTIKEKNWITHVIYR